MLIPMIGLHEPDEQPGMGMIFGCWCKVDQYPCDASAAQAYKATSTLDHERAFA